MQQSKELKISRWGNGQGIRLPLAVMKLLSLSLGDELKMEVKDQKIILTPEKKKKLTLAERFASYDGEMIKEEFWTDDSIGKELF